MSVTPSYKTYAITIRPVDGVDDDHISKFDKWCRKHCRYYHVVTEKTGSQRHLHAGIFLNVEKRKSDVCIMLCGLFKGLTATEKTVLRQGVKVMYNWDFIDVYLDKDDDTVVVNSSLPEERHLEGYFPPKPESTTGSRKKKCSLYLHELEALWYKHNGPTVEINTQNARHFMFKMMFSERCIPALFDDKKIINTARTLTRWLKRQEYDSIVLPPFEAEE